MSSTIEIIQFQPGHVHLLDRSDSDCAWLGDPASVFSAQAAAGSAWTLLIDKRVAVVGGVARLWPGLGEGWLLASPMARTKPVALTKGAMRGIAFTMQSLQLNRVQAHVKTSDIRAMKWAVALGFVREGTLRKYSPDGADYDVFAIVR
jgi:hypothetical protein